MRYQSFKIDGQRLRELREEKRLTQASLAHQICELLGLKQDEETYTAIYRRIEKRGSTSRERAEAIANILDVPLVDLQGIVPPDPSIYERRILELLTEQLSRDNAALQSALDEERQHGSEDALEWMARDVGRRIESAQLARNPAELIELSQLTGLSEEEILKPANVDGHWLVVVSDLGYTRTEIVRGAGGVLALIRDVVGDRLDHHRGSDDRIRMHRASPWYRLEIEQLRGRLVIRIDFVRCLPDANGLRWLNPSRRDVWLVEDPLMRWACSIVNFVTGFDGSPQPGDVRRLRLRVTEYNGKPSECISESVVAGCLEEIPDERFDAYQAEGVSHSAATLMLGGALREILEPRLSDYPRRCWDVNQTGDGCAIYLWPSGATQGIPYGLRYQIQLVEETAPGQFGPVPWREMDRAALKQRIEEWFN